MADNNNTKETISELENNLDAIDESTLLNADKFPELAAIIKELIAAKKLDSYQKFNFWSYAEYIGRSSQRLCKEAYELCDAIHAAHRAEVVENEPKTYDMDHTIPLQESNPLRDEIGIIEQWIIPNNEKVTEDELKWRSGLTSPHDNPDMKIYLELKQFLEDKKSGRQIYTTDAFDLASLYKGHQHPLGFVEREAKDNVALKPYADWELLFYNRKIGNKLKIDHTIGFEFGYLSNPYAEPIPEGEHLVALLRRRKSSQILEATVQPVPIKFWHPDTNAWYLQINFTENSKRPEK